MTKLYTEVNLEIIKELKLLGFTSLQLIPHDDEIPDQAIIEIIPGKSPDFKLNQIALDSPEIHEYLDGPSPMAKYMINKKYLTQHSV